MIAFNDNAAAVGAITYRHSGDFMVFTTNLNERVRIDSTGNVGIASTTPTHVLEVGGDIHASGDICTEVGGGICIGATGGGIQGVITDKGLQVDAGDNFGIKNSALNQIIKYNISGQWVCTADDTSALPSGVLNETLRYDGGAWVASSGITNDGTNVTIGGKLTVGTIDPVYEIGGKKYATYVTDFSGGVRIETSGNLTIKNGFKIIDFDKEETGNNLWLFWQTSIQSIDEIAVLLTPTFDGRVWYEKKPKKNQIIIRSSQDGEVSFRFTAPREDAHKWPNELLE